MSRFEQIDLAQAMRLEDQFGSPFYLLDVDGIMARFREFDAAAREAYPNSRIAISYKTNPTRAVLHQLHRAGALAEVISGDELQSALSLGVSAKDVVFNGPAKSDSDLTFAILNDCHLHCDHADEVRRVAAIAARLDVVAKIGIRLHFPTESSWERFGFWATADESCDAHQMINEISDSRVLRLSGLHSHIGTNIRDVNEFNRLGRHFADFIQSLDVKVRRQLEWIDFGGGLAGISPAVADDEFQIHELPCPRNYFRSLIDPLRKTLDELATSPRLLFEPGRTVFNAFGGLFTKVVGRRPAGSDGVESLILDAGITSIALAFKYNYPVHICKTVGVECENRETNGDNGKRKTYRLLGPTCMQQDIVAPSIDLPEIFPGDHAIIHATGCYSMAMASSFTHFRHGIVGWTGDDLHWLRKPETIAHSQLLDIL